MNNTYTLLAVIITTVITAALRFAPFLIFGRGRKTSPILEYMGKVLPFAIMGMLVVYCLKDVSLIDVPFGIPEAIGCAVVAGLHIWKRNTLLSIGAGTVCYMLLLQWIF